MKGFEMNTLPIAGCGCMVIFWLIIIPIIINFSIVLWIAIFYFIIKAITKSK